ncbi:MAG: protein adenylyltransferase SelO [Burkholderiales bacterium]
MLDTLHFDNRFTRELPADPQAANFRRQVLGACYSRVAPTPVAAPRLIACAREVAELLDITPATCASAEFAQVFSGNKLLHGMDPFAMCYGGHQFGHWARQLGDGRAIILGETVNRAGQRLALQLKGAGPTPYSRSADGLAVLRSSIREFLCSEAMHHLGVPTTRALCVVATGESVVRDMFYDGNPRPEPGAIVCRVAPSFTRFGNFEILASRKDIDLLRKLVDYTLVVDFPELGAPGRETYTRWFREVCTRTAVMVAHWMRVGFVHGVMNTDNMSVLGLTIDYGPYGWLENYDPGWTPNTTDAEHHRYRFGAQPQVAMWNLAQLGNALMPLVEDAVPLDEALSEYSKNFDAQWQQMMAEKLGFSIFRASSHAELISELQDVLQEVETDMPIFFRRLALLDTSPAASDEALLAPFAAAYYRPETLHDTQRQRTLQWVRRYAGQVRAEGVPEHERRLCMQSVNPKYVLRNYLAQLAIDRAEQNDYGLVNELLEVLRRPYDEQPDKETFAAKRPDWARQRPGCSMLSCSS